MARPLSSGRRLPRLAPLTTPRYLLHERPRSRRVPTRMQSSSKIANRPFPWYGSCACTAACCWQLPSASQPVWPVTCTTIELSSWVSSHLLQSGGGIIGTAKQVLGYGTPSEQQQTTTTPGTQVNPWQTADVLQSVSNCVRSGSKIATNVSLVWQPGTHCCLLLPIAICIAACVDRCLSYSALKLMLALWYPPHVCAVRRHHRLRQAGAGVLHAL